MKFNASSNSFHDAVFDKVPWHWLRMERLYRLSVVVERLAKFVVRCVKVSLLLDRQLRRLFKPVMLFFDFARPARPRRPMARSLELAAHVPMQQATVRHDIWPRWRRNVNVGDDQHQTRCCGLPHL